MSDLGVVAISDLGAILARLSVVLDEVRALMATVEAEGRSRD